MGRGTLKKAITTLLLCILVLVGMVALRSVQLQKRYAVQEQEIVLEEPKSYKMFRMLYAEESQLHLRYALFSGNEIVPSYEGGKVVQVDFKKVAGEVKVIFWNDEGIAFVADSADQSVHRLETDKEHLKMMIVGKYYVGEVMITGVEKTV